LSSVSGIDLNLLAALGALLEERNLTKAGARLNLTQPAMSAALTRLRQHFGDELLVRSGRQFVLTPDAERVLPAVQLALRQAERTFAETGEFDPVTSTREFSVAIAGESILALSGLVRRVHDLAPGVRIVLRPLPTELISGDRGLLQHDLLIAPLGFYRPTGQPEVICRDRFVCVADPGNPRLRDGRLTLEDLRAAPHATARLPHAEDDPVQAALSRFGITPNSAVTTVGWLTLPFLVADSDMVAIVPELLARRLASAAGVAVIEPPFGQVDLLEAAWWHPMRATDPAHTWLRNILNETVASSLPKQRRRPEEVSEPGPGVVWVKPRTPSE
jgi:DNA-binding transcriptional LysR family regulator